MADLLHRQLLEQARWLSRRDAQRPRQANLRRAVSSAYYAIFHCLIYHGTRALMGSAAEARGYRDMLARTYRHEAMNRACKPFAAKQLPKAIASRLPTSYVVSDEVREVANTFCLAQDLRHLADYDLAYVLKRSQVVALIRDVDEAIAKLKAVRKQPQTRFFLCCLLLWNTMENRK